MRCAHQRHATSDPKYNKSTTWRDRPLTTNPTRNLTAQASNSLRGQVAVITGAGRGIGQAIAIKLAELGAHTVLCGRAREALEQTCAAIENNGVSTSEKSSNKGPRKSS